MKTRLVYVLTCSPENYYIEQALMSIWSAKYHNPEAHIILITDDKTNLFLEGTRGELTNYITEKVVIPFNDERTTMMYRSRWIKTSVRQIIDGDFLFIDCDTIICKSLADVDSFECEVGAVLESHLLVEEFCDDLKNAAARVNQQIGVEIEKEKEYFSSGVLYVKDTPNAHQLFNYWHTYWLDSFETGLPIDQPSLAKANRESGHLIKKIPDTYNCILFTQNTFTDRAYILHIASYRNPSFLFTKKVFELLRENGLVNWVKGFLLHPCDSFLPFDYVIRKSSLSLRIKWIKSIATTSMIIEKELPCLLEEFPMKSSVRGFVLWLFHNKCYYLAAIAWMIWKRQQVLRKRGLKDNVCRK